MLPLGVRVFVGFLFCGVVLGVQHLAVTERERERVGVGCLSLM